MVSAAAPLMEERSRYTGYIKSFNPQKGWGHIECEETYALYGKDIFLLRSQLNGIIPKKGDEVYFSLAEGQQGIEAADVSLNSSSSAGQAYSGVIKSFNVQKGWGHIECEQTHAIYGKDIFLLRSQLSHGVVPNKGDKVLFNVVEGKQGTEASDVVIVPTANAMAFSGASPALWGATQTLGVPLSMQMYIGSIKSYDEHKGWGHIACDATRALYSKDMFVMKSALKGQPVNQGEQVQFRVVMGAKGPEAADVMVLRGGGMVGVSPWPGMHQGFQGTVKSYSPEQGWGHIECPVARSMYGKDIFLHSRALNGQVPQVGTPISFSVVLDAKDGRSTATNVVLGGQGFQAGKGAWVPFQRVGPY